MARVTVNSTKKKSTRDARCTMQRPNLSSLGCFEVYRILRSFFPLFFISPFHHPATRSFFLLARRDHFKAALSPAHSGSGVRHFSFFFLQLACAALAFSSSSSSSFFFFIRTNRSDSPRRNGINSRFTDLLARRSPFLFKRFTSCMLFPSFSALKICQSGRNKLRARRNAIIQENYFHVNKSNPTSQHQQKQEQNCQCWIFLRSLAR